MIFLDHCMMDDSIEKHAPFRTPGSSKNQDDDDTSTELLSSFASMMVSSIETLGESSWNNSSSTQNLTPVLPKTKGDLQYHLLKNIHECFGYLQFHVSVSCIHDVPTELSVVSGKTILYIQTTWTNGDPESTVDALVHPLVLEAIESLFIPVAIIPNRFDENQPCHHHYQLRITSIGFMDSNHQDLLQPITAPELSTTSVLGTAMIFVLNMNEQLIPRYLSDMIGSYAKISGYDQGTKEFERRAWFGFHDKIPTASELHTLEGVQRVQCGTFLDQVDDPIVEVVYNYKLTCYCSLVLHVLTKLTSHQIVIYCQSNDERMATRMEITKLSRLRKFDRQIAIVQVSKSIVFEPLIEIDLVPIRQTPLRYVPMTEFQASQTNQLVMDGQYDNAIALLSPRQLNILVTSLSHGYKDYFDVVGFSIMDGWISTTDKKPPYRKPKMRTEDKVNAELELYSI